MADLIARGAGCGAAGGRLAAFFGLALELQIIAFPVRAREPEGEPPPPRVWRVLDRIDPLGGALEHFERGNLACQRGDHLGRGRAGADKANPLAGEIDRPVPAGGVKLRPGKALCANDFGHHRVVQSARCRNDDVSLILTAILRGQLPCAVREDRRAHLLAQFDMRQHAIAPRDIVVVFPDFRAPGIAGLPAGIARERIGIEVCRDIAGDTGIDIVPPGPAHRAGFFQHDEIAIALFEQPDRHQHARNARSDNDEAGILARHDVFLSSIAANICSTATLDTLPFGVIGRASTNFQIFGTLKCASRAAV